MSFAHVEQLRNGLWPWMGLVASEAPPDQGLRDQGLRDQGLRDQGRAG